MPKCWTKLHPGFWLVWLTVLSLAGVAAAGAAAAELETQWWSGCSAAISPAQASFESAGGSGSFSVQLTGQCDWTATSDRAWLQVLSGGSGSASGTVSYQVQESLDSATRTATITVQTPNQRLTFTVTQTGPAGACQMIGALDTLGSARRVAAADSLAFVLNNNSGVFGRFSTDSLDVIGVADPSAPVLRGTLSAVGDFMDLAVSGNRAYLAGSGGFAVVDVTNPDSPAPVTSYETYPSENTATGIAVSGNWAYVIYDDGSLEAISLSGTSPVQQDSITYSPREGRGVAVSGNIVYAALAGGGIDSQGPSLVTIDVTDPVYPSSIFELGSIDLRFDPVALVVSGSLAYVLGGSTLEIIDVSIPATPDRVYSGNLFTDARGIAVVNGIAYVAQGTAGAELAVVDVSAPRSSSLVTTVSTGSGDGALGIAVSGSLAYLAQGLDGLAVVDISGCTQ